MSRVVGGAQRRRRPLRVERVARASDSCTSATSVGRSAATSSSWRRWARSSSLAVRNTFTGASGNTTEPMSRPSTTPPPCSSTHARCRATSWRAPRDGPRPIDTAAVTSGPRISRADVVAVEPHDLVLQIDARRPRRSGRTPRRRPRSARAFSTASVTDRYIAPVSSMWSPSAAATPRAMVDFPEPDGPSIATTRSVIAAPTGSSRSAAKPGYEIATAGQPRTVVSPSAARPATAAHIAIRWSPWLFSVAPSARRRGRPAVACAARPRCRAG